MFSVPGYIVQGVKCTGVFKPDNHYSLITYRNQGYDNEINNLDIERCVQCVVYQLTQNDSEQVVKSYIILCGWLHGPPSYHLLDHLYTH